MGSTADIVKAIVLLAATAGVVLALSICVLSVIFALGDRLERLRRRSA